MQDLAYLRRADFKTALFIEVNLVDRSAGGKYSQFGHASTPEVSTCSHCVISVWPA